jgi:hypothetical protein
MLGCSITMPTNVALMSCKPFAKSMAQLRREVINSGILEIVIWASLGLGDETHIEVLELLVKRGASLNCVRCPAQGGVGLFAGSASIRTHR